MRERRLAEIKYEMETKRKADTLRYGTYDTIKTEKILMGITTTTENCIVHFAHKDFKRCRFMDNHLQVCKD